MKTPGEATRAAFMELQHAGYTLFEGRRSDGAWDAIALAAIVAARNASYTVWLIDGECELWNAGSLPARGELVLSGTYEMCVAAVKAAPNGYRLVGEKART